MKVDQSVLQCTLCGSYCTAVGQCYCRLNEGCQSEHYVEGTAQQEDSFIAGGMEYVTESITQKVLLIKWSVILLVELSVLQ